MAAAASRHYAIFFWGGMSEDAKRAGIRHRSKEVTGRMSKARRGCFSRLALVGLQKFFGESDLLLGHVRYIYI